MVIKHGRYSIVLRPVALVLVAALAGTVAWRFLSAGGSALHDTVAAKNLIVSPIDNPDFEEAFLPATFDQEAKVVDRKAQVSGVIAAGWKDRSRWSDVTVDYSIVKGEAHHGEQAQKIEVRGVRSGKAKFCQGVRTLPGKRYRLTLWVRASRPMHLVFGLRQIQNDVYDARQESVAGADWKQVVVEGEATGQFSYLMLETADTGSLIVDDASFSEIGAAVSP